MTTPIEPSRTPPAVSRRRTRLRRTVVAAGTLATAGYIAGAHAPLERPEAASAAAPHGAALEQVLADPTLTTGALWLDLVDPAQGEGSSEAMLARWVAELDARAAVDAAPTSFYAGPEHTFRITGSPAALTAIHAELRAHPLVEGVEPEALAQLPEAPGSAASAGSDAPEALKPERGRFVPNDEYFALQWHMEQIRAPEAWAAGERGAGAVVAVIDTGVAWKTEHGVVKLPDLEGVSFVHGRSFIQGAPDGLDDHAHGSHVAGTIAQATHNRIGVAGVAHRATIMPLKVLSAQGSGGVGGIADAIRYAADNGAHVINMSLGSAFPSSALTKAIAYAHGKGVTVVCAAGNSRRARIDHPAAAPHAVAVGAVDYERNLTFYTNWGAALDVTAPGGDTRTDKNGDGHPDGVLQNTIQIQRPADNDYLWFQGTSMASPHAAGVAALIVGEGVTNPDEVERILKATAVHPKGVEWDEFHGAGIIDAAAATERARAGQRGERAALGGWLGALALGGAGLGAVAQAAARGGTRALALQLGGGALAFALAVGLLGAPAAYAFGTTAGVGLAGALGLSCLLPLVATLLLLGVKPLRGALVGLNLGWSAVLLHGALALPTLLAFVPGGGGVDRLWLALNGLLALALARRVATR